MTIIRYATLLLFIICFKAGYSQINRVKSPKAQETPIQTNCFKINWTSWSSFTGLSALGTINNGGRNINVTMTSNFTFDSTPTIYNYAAKLAGYPEAIPNTTVPRTTWSKGTGGITEMCFSEKVTNPVLLLASLGASNGTRSKLTFSVPYIVIHDGGNMEYHDSYSLTGIEGNAIILFPGDFTCVTVNSTTEEFYTNITWGLKPSPFQVNIKTIANNCNFSTVSATGGVSYKWNGGDTPNKATNTFRQSGTYIVTVTNENGCTSSASVTVTLNNSPASISENSECGKTTLTAIGGVSYSWNGGESPNSATNVFYESGVYTVTIVDKDGCVTTISKNVLVAEIPRADFTISPSMCASSSVTFRFIGNDATITSWEWDFGDGNVSADKSPEHSYLISGNYQVKLKVKNNKGCVSDITEKTIKVANTPPGQGCCIVSSVYRNSDSV